MKKRFTLFSFLMFAGLFMYGQTLIWEDFSAGQVPPTGWTINGLTTQWSCSTTNNAGGIAPEAMFTYTNGTTITRFISPMLNTTGLTTIRLSFKHMYDFYSSPAPKAGVATRSHSGTWNTVWEITPTASVPGQQIDITINNADVGQSEFQICFYLNGNMYNMNYWYLDNILLFNPLNKDGFLYSLGATSPFFAGPSDVKGSVMNVGLTAITSLDIDWQIDAGPVFSSSFTGLSIPTQGSYDFTCADPMNPPVGPHNLTVWIRNVNGSPDDNQSNDTLTKTVGRVCYANTRIPLFEEFTSSTCNPCASFNLGFVPWCTLHADSITLLKYQMNWPGTGDPYYTAEGGVRRDFYGVTWVPWLQVGGSFVNTTVSDVQTAFDNSKSLLGMFDIASTHSFTGHVVNFCTNILPFYNFPAAKAYISVYEKVTHNNASTNGETAFEHVMMKMVPGAFGAELPFVDRQPVTFCDTLDLTGTNVEEWNDLMVVVWVQDTITKEILQSAYSVENGTYATEDRLSSITVNGTPVPSFDPNTLSYNVVLPSGTTTVPTVVGIPIDLLATVIPVPPLTLPGTATIDVFAENNINHKLYTLNYSFPVGQDEKKADLVSLHPNPTTGIVYITGAYHARISICSLNGSVLRNFADFTSTSLNLGDLNKGVYVLKIERTDGSVVNSKIVLL